MTEKIKIEIVARDKVKAAADLAREIWENRNDYVIPDEWWERANELFGSDKTSGDEDGHDT